MPEPLFIPAPFFLLRSPLWSMEDCQRIFEKEDWIDAVFNLYETEGLLQEAIAIASPSLHAALQKRDFRRSEAIAASLFNYAVRMASRATPFGLFSFVGMGSWGQKTEVSLDLSKIYKRARPNMTWIYALIQKSYKGNNFSLLVQTNPLSRLSGERVFHSYARRAEKEGNNTIQTFSIRATQLVKAILHLSREPKKISTLSKELLLDMPELDRQKVEGVIQELLSQQFLLPGILPSLLKFSPFEELLPYFEEDSIIRKIEIYGGSPLGKGMTLLEELQKDMKAIAPAKNPLQVDAAYKGSPICLSEEIGKELAGAASMLWKISPRRSLSTPLQAHHAKFIEKYGMDRTVPLLELLSEERGLGPLESPQLFPPFKPVSAFDKQWEKWLYGQWQKSLHEKKQEIVLTKDLVDRLFALAGETSHDPQEALDSIDIFCKVIADSPEQIDQGNFLLAFIQPTWQGGSAIGRFIDLFDEKIEAQLSQFFHEEQQLEKETHFVEVSYWPVTGHHANVAIHPCFRKYRLDLGAKKWNAYSLSLEDIYVGATRERFYLTLKEGGPELIARVGNLLNPKFAPAPLHFMREVTLARYQLLYPFLWGSLEEKSVFLPRVRFQRTVLSPAQWRADADLFCKNSPEKISSQFTAWADLWNLPRHSFLVRDDQHLLIDRNHPAHLKEIALHLKKRESLQFFESFTTPWVKSKRGHHLCEFVVPFLKNPHYATKKSIISPAYVEVPIENRLKGVGSEWLFIKLYLEEEGVNHFLTDHFSPFAEKLCRETKIAGWFFVRYRDPKNHIRCRLRLNDAAPLPLILSMLQNLSLQWIKEGLIKDLVLANYEREVERYGGSELIEAAEVVFCADSLATLSLLSDSLEKEFPLPLLHALSVIGFLKGFGLDEREMIALLSRGSDKQTELNGFRAYKNRLAALAEAEPLSKALRVRKGAQEFFCTQAQSLSANALSAIYDSMLHMHCNRLGCDAAAEQRARLYAKHALYTNNLKNRFQPV